MASKKPKNAKKSAAGGSKVTVRMYRVGFGDCFLVRFPQPGNPKFRYMLIDCGVHGQSKYRNISGAVKAIEEETGGKVAVVCATHAHADHISGFGSERDTFAKFEVEEVWLPWFENLDDPKAKKLHTKAAALADLLNAHVSRAGAAADPVVAMIAENALGATGKGVRSANGNNAKALELLRGGFGNRKKVKYLTAGVELSEPGGIKGLTVQVLAPSSDEKFLSRMDPPSSQDYHLDADGSIAVDTLVPFAPQWQYASMPADGGAVEAETAAYLAQLGLSVEEVQTLTKEVAVPLQSLALSVDNYLNNTSVAVLLQFKGKNLFFPGDAQWGNWNSWQADWQRILGDIDFYKVGHHGSHNATPTGALDLMKKGAFVAMASTDTVTKFNAGNFPVPYKKLVTKVKEQAREYFQSDELGLPAANENAKFCDYDF